MTPLVWSEKQKEMFYLERSDKLLTVACGEARSGKSLSGLLGFLRYNQTNFHDTSFVLSCYSDPVWNGMIREYCELFEARGGGLVDFGHKGVEIRSKIDGVEHVNFYGRVTGRDISAVTRIQGNNYRGVWATEAAAMPPDLIHEFFVRMLTFVAVEPQPKVVLDCNPEGGPQHPFKVDWIDRIVDGVLPEGRYFTFTMEDNPAMTEEAKQMIGNMLPEGHVKRRKMNGEWVDASGLIHDLPGYGCIVRQPKGEPSQYDVAIDTASSGVTHAILVAHYPKEFCFVDEWRHDGQNDGEMSPAKQIQQINRQFSRRGKISRWVSDVGDGFPASLQEARKKGQITGTIFKPHKDVDLGIQTLTWAFQRRRVTVTQKCPWFILDCGRYSWDPKAAQQGEDKPIKKNDHGPDAARYWIMMHEQGRVHPGTITTSRSPDDRTKKSSLSSRRLEIESRRGTPHRRPV